jgi:phosphate:Na+ symporter
MVDAVTTPDWTALALGLAGGLALFLIGMDQMTDALKALAGHRLQRILARLSGNRVAGAATGAVTTMALQSSSVTTVLTVSFVSASMLTLPQAASVIIGANLGTTVTAQIIALDAAGFSLVLIALGAVLWLFVPRRQWQQSGRAIASLGLIFLGLQVMSDAMRPLGSYPPVLDALSGTTSPALAVLLGAGVTALVQSSSATTGVVVAMAASGLVDLPTGIAIILGANIGTCVTAVIAAIGKGRDALRTALVHVTVNLLGALFWLLFLPVLVDIVEAISPAEVASPRQLANAHTLFNAVNTVVFLILLTPLVALVRRMVPIRHRDEEEPRERSGLEDCATGTAALGLDAVDREVVRLASEVGAFLDEDFPAVAQRPVPSMPADEDIEQRKTVVRRRHRAIVAYLAELSHTTRDEEQSRQLLGLLSQADELAHAADLIGSSLRRVARRRRRSGVSISEESGGLLVSLQHLVTDDLARTMEDSPLPALADEIEGRLDAIAAARTAGISQAADVDRYVVESDLADLLARLTHAVARLREVREAGERSEP